MEPGDGAAGRSRPVRSPGAWILPAVVAFLLPLRSEGRPVTDGAAPPSWVERFPHDPDQYIGIGSADKRAHPGDYRDLARASALAQISREISVQVVAGNTATRTEDAGGQSETYADRITTTTRNALAGYRLEGVYETADRFWAYYALDKDTWEKALEERERRVASWLDAEAAALDADLGARRIQGATDRYARIRKMYDSSFTQDNLLRDRSGAIPSRFNSLSRKMQSAVRGTRLATTASVWNFSLPASSSINASPHTSSFASNSMSASIPRPTTKTTNTSMSRPGTSPIPDPAVFVTDAATGASWNGPLSLTVAERAHPDAPACPMEADAEGRVDLSRPFLECGLDPGVWRVAWMGPEGTESHFDIGADWKRIDIAVSITADWERRKPGRAETERRESADADLIARLRYALEGMAGRRYRIVPGKTPLPTLNLRILEVTLDSLEGLYFASLRADAVLPSGFGEAGKPGAAGSVDVRGKGGHTEKDRARAAAIGDFARGLQAALEGPAGVSAASGQELRAH